VAFYLGNVVRNAADRQTAKGSRPWQDRAAVYNGLQYFGGLVAHREYGNRELEFIGTNRLLSDALAADKDTPYILDVFRAISRISTRRG